MTAGEVRYRVCVPRGQAGGELVSVFADSAHAEVVGALAEQAKAAETPLSVFIAACEDGTVSLYAFTSRGEPSSSDSASLAALHFLTEAGRLGDWASVTSPSGDDVSAQLCGGMWLLAQGKPNAKPLLLSAEAQTLIQGWPVPLSEAPLSEAQLTQTTLLLPVRDLAALQDFSPDAPTLSALGQMTGCAGLVLYVLAAPEEPLGLRRADVSLRAFVLAEGQEEVVSSEKCACLVAGLGARGLWPTDSSMLRAAQLAPGQPALLTAQFSEVGETVWVGGSAERLSTRLSSEAG